MLTVAAAEQDQVDEYRAAIDEPGDQASDVGGGARRPRPGDDVADLSRDGNQTDEHDQQQRPRRLPETERS